MIKTTTIKIPSNYVLVKPDKNFETYQFGGIETGIIAAQFTTDEKGNQVRINERHYAASGIVIKAPQKLNFNLDEIAAKRRKLNMSSPEMALMKELDSLLLGSVIYDVPVEVLEGDRVHFDYLAYEICEKEAKFIQTEDGEMMLIKYDMLRFAERNGEEIMLNGWVKIVPEIIDAHENEDFKKVGLLLVPVERTNKISDGTAVGHIDNLGTICKGYLEFPDRGDPVEKIKVGDRIVYDSQYGISSEYINHQTKKQKTNLIHRKDIKAIYV